MVRIAARWVLLLSLLAAVTTGMTSPQDAGSTLTGAASADSGLVMIDTTLAAVDSLNHGPQVVWFADPVYPQAALERGLQGTVKVAAFVDDAGEVAKAFVHTGLDSLLDATALHAVGASIWAPARQRGEPLGCWVVVPIRFQLGPGAGGSGSSQGD
jgi:TonB family protein